MQFHKPFAGLLLTLGVALSACTTDVIEVPREELYAREFIKQFGVVDPNHDWTAALHTSITVKTAVPTDLKIIATYNGKKYRFGDFKQVLGTRTLNFDVPQGYTNLILRTQGRDIKVDKGSMIDLSSSSRTVSNPSSEGGSGVTATLCTDPTDWMVVPMLNATIFRRRMPENCYNSDRDGVHVDFTFKFSQQDIIVRPLYWQTNQVLEFGFFYIDDNGEPIRYPIYAMEKDTKGGNMDNQVLCWAPTETRSIVIEDFMNNQEFMKCLNNHGITVVPRTDTNNNSYNYIDIYSTDNFLGITSAKDDHNMTFACREYLISKGIENNPNNSEDKRFNYVYRWQLTGDCLKNINQWNQEYDIYDASFIHNEKRQPRKDLTITYTIYNYDYSKADGWANTPDMISDIKMDDDNYPALISKGIKVHFDDISKTYGGYVKRGTNRYLYSVSRLNEKTRWIPAEGAERNEEYWDSQSGNKIWRYPDNAFIKDENNRAFRAATWIGQKYNWRYLSFEDGEIGDTYNRTSCDFDMQDFVFLIDGAEPGYDDPTTVEDPEEPKEEPIFPWIVACEDLGGTFDHDFNDIVFGVQHVAGSDEAYITALAAGGTLPIRLYYNGTEIKGGSDENGDQYTVYTPTGTKEFTEWHQWFGKPYTTPTNVQGFEVGATVRIKVSEDFSMSGTPDNPNISISANRLGGFHLEVDQPGGSIQSITAPVQTSQAGNNVPQMFVTTSNYEWPTEKTPIYFTHRGDTNQPALGEEKTPTNTSITGYFYHPNSFHAWALNGTTHSGFHSQKATEQDHVVKHGWKGYQIPLTK